jgi:hypothetical protein
MFCPNQYAAALNFHFPRQRRHLGNRIIRYITRLDHGFLKAVGSLSMSGGQEEKQTEKDFLHNGDLALLKTIEPRA